MSKAIFKCKISTSEAKSNASEGIIQILWSPFAGGVLKDQKCLRTARAETAVWRPLIELLITYNGLTYERLD